MLAQLQPLIEKVLHIDKMHLERDVFGKESGNFLAPEKERLVLRAWRSAVILGDTATKKSLVDFIGRPNAREARQIPRWMKPNRQPFDLERELMALRVRRQAILAGREDLVGRIHRLFRIVIANSRPWLQQLLDSHPGKQPYLTRMEEQQAFRLYRLGLVVSALSITEPLEALTIRQHDHHILQAAWARRHRAPLEDLELIGKAAVVRAMHLFNYTRGTRFLTQVKYWIRQHTDRCGDEEQTMAMPPPVYFDLGRMAEFVRVFRMTHNGERPSDEQLAEGTGLPLNHIIELRQLPRFVSAESPVGVDGDAQLIDFIEDPHAADPSESCAEKDIGAEVRAYLDSAGLALQERRVIILRFNLRGFDDEMDRILDRWEKRIRASAGIKTTKTGAQGGLDGMTLDEVSEVLGKTKECMRQNEMRALRKMRFRAGVALPVEEDE